LTKKFKNVSRGTHLCRRISHLCFTWNISICPARCFTWNKVAGAIVASGSPVGCTTASDRRAMFAPTVRAFCVCGTGGPVLPPVIALSVTYGDTSRGGHKMPGCGCSTWNITQTKVPRNTSRRMFHVEHSYNLTFYRGLFLICPNCRGYRAGVEVILSTTMLKRISCSSVTSRVSCCAILSLPPKSSMPF